MGLLSGPHGISARRTREKLLRFPWNHNSHHSQTSTSFTQCMCVWFAIVSNLIVHSSRSNTVVISTLFKSKNSNDSVWAQIVFIWVVWLSSRTLRELPVSGGRGYSHGMYHTLVKGMLLVWISNDRHTHTHTHVANSIRRPHTGQGSY